MTFQKSRRLRIALLSSAALAISLPVIAHADELSDLKKEVQALNARLAQLEKEKSQPAAQETLVRQQDAKVIANTSAGDVPATPKTENSDNVLGVLQQPIMLYHGHDTSLHIYGIIEGTISGWSNQPNANGNGKPSWATGFQTAWFSGNRLGFDVDHALTSAEKFGLPDLKVIAKLEAEFESPSGNMDTPGVLFNRDAWIGFQSPELGKLTFGRQNTVTRDFTQTWGDPYGTPFVSLNEGGYSNVNNFKQIIFYSASSTTTRNDSGIVWKKSFLGDHMIVGLDYSFGSQGVGGSGNGGIGNMPLLDGGGGSPGQFKVGSNQAISLAYNNLEVGGGQLSWNVNYNRSSCGNFGDDHCDASDPSAGNYVNQNTNQAFLTGGTYVFDGWRVGAGYIRYIAQQHTNTGNLGDRKDNVWIVDGTIPVRPISKDLDLYWGAWEAFGHNSALYAGNNLVVLPFFISTANSTKTVNGSRINATVSLMYHLDKQTDIYFAYDYQLGRGGWSHTLFDTQGNGGGPSLRAETTGIGTGVRLKF
ncbi:porin [Dyella lipolytica]|uniref:Porin n=1 Tax=Dyella lipolytica TaxID=1867835 RepID=A0ABW8IVC7_9GAMM